VLAAPCRFGRPRGANCSFAPSKKAGSWWRNTKRRGFLCAWQAAPLVRNSVYNHFNDPNFDIAPDGKRFAVVMATKKADEKPRNELTVLLNFFTEIHRRSATRAQ
jgi:hypothetical protein